MPLFIQNQNEIRNADDGPLRANTPSTGSMCDDKHATECGNRVLNLLEKHKREFQARVANNERSFKTMLEKHTPNKSRSSRLNNEMSLVGESLPERSRIVKLYHDAFDKNKGGQKSVYEVRASSKDPASNREPERPNPPTVESDEYFAPPTNYEATSRRVLEYTSQVQGSSSVPYKRRDDSLITPINNFGSYQTEREVYRDNDSAIYEPDGESDLEECCISNDFGITGTTINRVLPELSNTTPSDPFDSETSSLKKSKSRQKQEVPKPQESHQAPSTPIPTPRRHQTPPPGAHSSRSRNQTGITPSQGGSSEHNLTFVRSSGSRRSFVVSDFLEKYFWHIMGSLAGIVAFFGLLLSLIDPGKNDVRVEDQYESLSTYYDGPVQ